MAIPFNRTENDAYRVGIKGFIGGPLFHLDVPYRPCLEKLDKIVRHDV